MNQTSKSKKSVKGDAPLEEKSKKNSKKELKKIQDKKYINISASVDDNSSECYESDNNEGFSIKDLPIASVVITIILTMMMLVMTSGFGGI